MYVIPFCNVQRAHKQAMPLVRFRLGYRHTHVSVLHGHGYMYAFIKQAAYGTTVQPRTPEIPSCV